jgi:hypothetical protein
MMEIGGSSISGLGWKYFVAWDGHPPGYIDRSPGLTKITGDLIMISWNMPQYVLWSVLSKKLSNVIFQ